MSDGGDFVAGAAKRAERLEKMAAQVEAIRWTVPGVLRENAKLIQGLLIEIEELRQERDTLLRYIGISGMGELPSGHV